MVPGVPNVSIVPGPHLFPPPRRGGGLRRGTERLEQLERFEPVHRRAYSLVSRVCSFLFAYECRAKNLSDNTGLAHDPTIRARIARGF